MASIAYFSHTSQQPYSVDSFSYIQSVPVREAIINIADLTGAFPAAIAGAMAEENDGYRQGELINFLSDRYALSGLDPITFANEVARLGLAVALTRLVFSAFDRRTHAQWAADYLAVGGDTGYAPSEMDKALHPVYFDLGYGNFKMTTAIRLVQQHGASPDLGLSGYLDDYALLANDLVDPSHGVTASLYGLMIREAERWFTSRLAYGADWATLPQEIKDALYVTYVNLGPLKMQERYQETSRGGLPYEPLPAVAPGGGLSHLYNAAALATVVGVGDYGNVRFVSSANQWLQTALTETAEGLAYREALLKLRPFAVLDDRDVNASGQLSLYHPETDLGTMSEKYLQDRTDFLEWKIKVREAGAQPDSTGTYSDSNGGSHSLFFKDSASQLKIVVGSKASADYILFGDDRPNGDLQGSTGKDHLYGGGGSDTLTGEAEDDYLEGNRGDDVLNGGAGKDELLGGLGDDTLDGGPNDDTLNGGIGFDTYRIHVGDGHDRIVDTDWQGRLIVDDQGKLLLPAVLRETAPGSGDWASDDGRIHLSQTSTWVLTLPGGGSIEFGEGFQPDAFGIQRVPALGESETHVMGDLQPRVQTTGSNRGKWATDLTLTGASNLATTGQPAPGFSDALLGGARHDWLQGLAGNDVLAGAEGDDRLDGGEGNDLLTGGDGADTLYGGDGNDYLAGGWSYNGGQPTQPDFVWSPPAGRDSVEQGRTWGVYLESGQDADGQPETVRIFPVNADTPADGADTLRGGAGDDELWGGRGDDLLDGGSGNDRMRGGSGDDQIDCGDGNDQLLGDGTLKPGYLDSIGTLSQGDDVLSGGAGDDSLTGQGGNDVLLGGDGTDRLFGDDDPDRLPLDRHGDDYLDGGAGPDLLHGDGGSDQLLGGLGDDELYGDAGEDRLDGGNGKDRLWGGEGDDQLLGGPGDDELPGESGDDRLDGGDGKDRLWGEAGDDILEGGGQNDVLSGGDGADVLIGGTGVDTLAGDSGDDTLFGGEGNEAADFGGGMSGGAGNDSLYGEAGDDVLQGDDGDDRLYGGIGADSLYGDNGNDELRGEAGDDYLEGGDGDDHLDGGAGADTLVGGAGLDTFAYSGGDDTIRDDDVDNQLDLHFAATQDIRLAADANGVQYLRLVTAQGMINIAGGFLGRVGRFIDAGLTVSLDEMLDRATGNFAINGTDAADEVHGGGGADQLDGGGGDDRLSGGRGSDRLLGGKGNDRLEGGAGADSMDGGVGDDVYVVDHPLDRIADHSGIDTVEASVSIDFRQVENNNQLEHLTLTGDAPIDGNGNSLSNRLIGNVAANRLQGWAGDDRLEGWGGDDTLEGGSGNDTLIGGGGGDRLRGSDGYDTARYDLSSAGVTVNLLAGSGSGGDAEGDRLESIEQLVGSGAADTLIGDRSGNTLIGLAGDDTLDGGDGADILDGGLGADRLLGGAESDLYRVDDPGDQVIELGSNLGDVVEASIDYTLPSGVEGLRLLGDRPLNGTGNAGGNEITGNGADNVLLGNDGRDRLDGLDGNDQLEGGSDDDSLYGGAGDDRLDGGDGNDQLFGGSGADHLIGRAGADTASYRDSAAGVQVDLSLQAGIGGDAEGDRLSQIESLEGSDRADILVGDGADNTLSGNGGDDRLSGLGGVDRLWGGAGADTLDGGAGDDALLGGADADTYRFGFGYGRDWIYETDRTAAALDSIELNSGIEPAQVSIMAVLFQFDGYGDVSAALRLRLAGVSDRLLIDRYFLGDGSQPHTVGMIRFNDPAKTVWDRRAIQDRLWQATAADDLLFGDADDNVLTGGDGNDTFWGGGGADRLVGGAGDDHYVADAYDQLIELPGAGIDTADFIAIRQGYGVAPADTYRLPTDIDNGVLHSDGTLLGNALDNQLSVAEGEDAFYGEGIVRLVGGPGADRLAGNTEVYPTADYADSAAAVEVSLLTGLGRGGDAEGDVLIRIAHLNGSAYADGLTGDERNNRLLGARGDDRLVGGAGDDTLDGGDGQDRLDGGSGNDRLVGGPGADWLNGGSEGPGGADSRQRRLHCLRGRHHDQPAGRLGLGR